MPNMSYCRFANTLADLRDCANALHESRLGGDELTSQGEHEARAELIALCAKIAEEWGEHDFGTWEEGE